jgi:hypothetical protein
MTVGKVQVPLDLEWRIPWEGALAEDVELQAKAAERLVTYLEKGTLHFGNTGQRRVRLIKAEAVEFDLAGEPPGRRWGISLSFEADIEVRV